MEYRVTSSGIWEVTTAGMRLLRLLHERGGEARLIELKRTYYYTVARQLSYLGLVELYGRPLRIRLTEKGRRLVESLDNAV